MFTLQKMRTTLEAVIIRMDKKLKTILSQLLLMYEDFIPSCDDIKTSSLPFLI